MSGGGEPRSSDSLQKRRLRTANPPFGDPRGEEARGEARGLFIQVGAVAGGFGGELTPAILTTRKSFGEPRVDDDDGVDLVVVLSSSSVRGLVACLVKLA